METEKIETRNESDPNHVEYSEEDTKYAASVLEGEEEAELRLRKIS